MPQSSDINNSMASGEIGEDAWERSDLAQIATGCEAALNFLGLTTGAIVSRGGFYDRGAPKFQGTAQRLIPWAREDGDNLVVELGHLYGRVWTASGAPIETSPGVPYEFSHGYSAGDLKDLRFKQVGDVMFVTSRYGLLNTIIQRFSDTNFVAGITALRNGPWLAENTVEDKGLLLTDLGGGAVSVECAGAGWGGSFPFLPQHVGSQLLIRPPGGYPGLLTWAPNTVKGAADAVISGGRIYQTAAGGTTGNTPPSHEAGTVSDGGVAWTFVHDGATAFLITAYVGPDEVTTAPIGTPPFDLTSPVTTPNWSFQSFSDVEGRPTAQVAVYQERLVFAGAPKRPDTLDMTRTAGFTATSADFKPGLGTGLVVDDDACRAVLGDNRKRIIWMEDALGLVVGTEEAEWIVTGATLDDPVSPSAIKPRKVSAFGSADVMPVVVQGPPSSILHVARGGTTLRELQLGGGAEVGLGDGRDLSILASHIFGKGMAELAWSRPDNNLWIRLADGTLACMTYHREHGVLGVRRQPIAGGWLAESLCCSPDLTGQDRVHVAAYRTKAGVGVQRRHFVLSQRADGVFMDCADYYTGTPVSTVAGLSVLEGEAVAVLADGAEVTGLTVSSGQITLPEPASNIIVGLPLTRQFKTLPHDPDGRGLPLAKVSRPITTYISMKGVHAFVRAEPQDSPDDRTIYGEDVLQRRPGDTVPVVRRKRARVHLGSPADRDVRVIVETSKPYDLQIFSRRDVFEAPK